MAGSSGNIASSDFNEVGVAAKLGKIFYSFKIYERLFPRIKFVIKAYLLRFGVIYKPLRALRYFTR